jgi:flavin reductase (DIM6/NTAB) family NADH-FMN oxidoreductase RutF
MTEMDPSAEYDRLDPAALDVEQRYKFLTGSVVPRPIALVTSVGENGVVNAAPFSQFIIICSDPAMLGFVASKGPRGEKDTLANIRASREYVINTVSEPLAEQVQHCSIPYPPEVSEVEMAGFGLLPSVRVAAPRIRQSRLQFECRLHRMEHFGIGGRSTLIVGEVLLVHAAPGVLNGHRVDHARLEPLGRIGGRRYCRTSQIIDV